MDDASDDGRHERRLHILDDWRRKKLQMRRMVERLEDIQRRANETRGRIDVAIDRLDNKHASYTIMEPSVAFQSVSPPRELTTCATQTLSEDDRHGGPPQSCARLAARSRSASTAPHEWSERRAALQTFFQQSKQTSPPSAPRALEDREAQQGQSDGRRGNGRPAKKHQEGIGSVVEGLMAAAMPTLVGNAQRMKRAADKFTDHVKQHDVLRTHSSGAHTRPSRDDVLFQRCHQLPNTCSLRATSAPPTEAHDVVAVHLNVISDAPLEAWCECVLLMPREDELRYIRVSSASGPREPLPLCLDVGAWRGHVLELPTRPYCVSLEPRWDRRGSEHTAPPDFPRLQMQFDSFTDLERFVGAVKSGQRRVTAEWEASLQ